MTAALTCEPPPIVRKSGQEPHFVKEVTSKAMLPVAFHARLFAVSLNWWGRWRQRRRQRRRRRRLGAGRGAELAAVITCQPPVLVLHFRPRCLVLGGGVLRPVAKVGAAEYTRVVPGAIGGGGALGGAVAFFGRKRLRARHEARQEQGDTLSRRRPSRSGSRSSSGDAPARAEAKRLRLATVERPQVG